MVARPFSLFLFSLLLLLLFGCVSPSPPPTPTPTPPQTSKGGLCNTDADCGPVQCCHPTSCGTEDMRERCEGIFCTLECRLGTMDCGAGSCACVNGSCVVRWAQRGNE